MSEIIKELLKENNARERNKQQKSALRNKTLVYLSKECWEVITQEFVQRE